LIILLKKLLQKHNLGNNKHAVGIISEIERQEPIERTAKGRMAPVPSSGDYRGNMTNHEG
jgi:hypothetical protein